MIVLESVSGNKLRKEEQIIFDFYQTVPKEKQFEIVKVPLKHLQRGKFVIKPGEVILLSGSIPFVHTALRQLGRPVPIPNDYPEGSECYLHRNITYGTKVNIVQGKLPLFIKPAKSLKMFTGFVCDDIDDYRLRGVHNNTQLMFSNVVNWVSEWRYYCSTKSIYEGSHYSGNSSIRPDPYTVHEIIQMLGPSSSLDAKVFDIGVLDTGETALVEINDAYSVGYYDGVSPMHYQSMISRRWQGLSGLKSQI